ncbi:MAG: glutathione S-transferase family protein [Thermodesulfobacteriota bacterium]
MIKLYDNPLSGNSYKARLLLAHLGVEYEKVTVDIFKGEHKSDDFTKLNPNQKIPVLADEEYIIWESNAILIYLAKKYLPNQYISEDPNELGLISQWLIFGKTSIDPFLAVSRYFLKFLGEGNYDKNQLDNLQNQGKHSLNIVDKHLSDNDFLAFGYSIADMACYPYVMLSHEGGFEISEFPNVEKWCKRVEKQPGFLGFADK